MILTSPPESGRTDAADWSSDYALHFRRSSSVTVSATKAAAAVADVTDGLKVSSFLRSPPLLLLKELCCIEVPLMKLAAMTPRF